MWIFLSDTFLSVIQPKPDDSDMLLVRARVRGDIENIFPDAGVLETPRHDYRFRAFVARADVEMAMAAEVRRINYPNFKGSVAQKDRHDAYMRCWMAMNALQANRQFDEQYPLKVEEKLAPPLMAKIKKVRRKRKTRQVWSGR